MYAVSHLQQADFFSYNYVQIYKDVLNIDVDYSKNMSHIKELYKHNLV